MTSESTKSRHLLYAFKKYIVDGKYPPKDEVFSSILNNV